MDDSPFLMNRHQEPLPVPVDITVVLVGFHRDGHNQFFLETQDLHDLLEAHWGTREPAVITATGAEPLHFRYEVDYRVVNAPHAHIAAYEKSIITAAKIDEGSPRAIVEAPELEDALTNIYRDSVESGAAIIIVNPDSERVMKGLKQLDDQLDSYAMSYEGGPPTQAWVAGGMYAVLDLTAGPCNIGTAGVGEGTVHEFSVPRVPKSNNAHSKTHRVFLAQLATVIGKAMQLVFAPDVVHQATTPFASHISVPALVLRDHDRVSNVNGGETHLDFGLVSRAMQGCLLPGQHFSIVPVFKHIADHIALAQAVDQAVRSNTVFAVGSSGRFEPTHRAEVDAGLLAAGLRAAPDELGAGILYHHASGSFSGEETELEQLVQEGDHVVVVPLYILSMFQWHATDEHGLSAAERSIEGAINHEPLFAGRAQFSVQDDMVMVLQLDAGDLEVPWVSDSGKLSVNGRKPIASVIAGLLEAVAAVAPPTAYWSHAHGTRLTEYLWAMGAHPFAPFGRSTIVSALIQRVSQRNLLLMQLHASLRLCQDAVTQLEEFVDTHLRDGFHSDISHKHSTRAWIDLLYHKQAGLPTPFAKETVVQFHNSIDELGKQLVELSQASTHVTEGTLQQAKALAQQATAFHASVRKELVRATKAMECCTTRRFALRPPGVEGLAFALLAILFLTAVGLAFAFKLGTRRRWSPRSGI